MSEVGRAVASEAVGRLFGSIESSDEYVAGLLQAVESTATDVGEDLRVAAGLEQRRREALQLVAFKLEQLRSHLTTSRRRLSDLRNLRLILDGELGARQETEAEERPAA